MQEYSVTTTIATEQLGCTEEELALLVRYNALTATLSKETGEVLIVVDDAYSKIVKSKVADYILEAIDNDSEGRQSIIGKRVKIINGLALHYARGDQRTPYRVMTPTKYIIRFKKLDDALRTMLDNNNFTQRSFMVKRTADVATYVRFTATQAREILQYIPSTDKYKYIRQRLLRIMNNANIKEEGND